METERSSSWIKKKKKVRVFLHFGEEMRENVPSSLDDVSFCADSFCRASSRKMISSSMFVVVVVVVFVLFFFFVLLSLLMCYRSSFFFFFLLFNFYMGSLIGCYFFRLVDIFFFPPHSISLSLFSHTHIFVQQVCLCLRRKKKFLFALSLRRSCFYSEK